MNELKIELKKMDFKQLKKYAKKIQKEGISIENISGLEDSKENRNKLRKIINNAKSECKTYKNG